MNTVEENEDVTFPLVEHGGTEDVSSGIGRAHKT